MIADGFAHGSIIPATKGVTPAAAHSGFALCSRSAIATSYSQIRALPGRIYSDRQGVKILPATGWAAARRRPLPV